MLTKGKRRTQEKSIPQGSVFPTEAANERLLRLRWLALLLYLSSDIAPYAKEFQEVLALPRG